jgi:TolB protein
MTHCGEHGARLPDAPSDTAINIRYMRHAIRLLPLAGALLATPAAAQWSFRYPQNAGYAHHVYLEGYELPMLAAGPTDVAASPDGRQLAFAAQGWIWVLDLATGEARRLTRGAQVDARPAWSPDGTRIAFVRDDGRSTAIVTRQLSSGDERELDRGMALDPAFARDGSLYYSSLEAGGDLDLRRIDLASGTRTRLTTAQGIELRPMPHPDGARLLYIAKSRSGRDELRLRRAGVATDTTLLRGNILSQFRPALSPDGLHLAYAWPAAQGWELRLLSLAQPGTSGTLVARPRGRPLAPAWSADGRTLFFSEFDTTQRVRLYRVSMNGGAVHEVIVKRWSWGVPTARVTINTRDAARMSVTDASGHPLVPAAGLPHFDGQNGIVYFNSPGQVTLTLPAGDATVLATRGLATVPVKRTISLTAGTTTPLRVALTPLWDAPAHGWFAADHHFHINYGGVADLSPASMLPVYRAEALDVVTPMLANLSERDDDVSLWQWKTTAGTRPMVAFAHEVRSHFLGHVGLLGVKQPFWPWGWGPGYDVYPRDDRPNGDALAFARADGGLTSYVHPSSIDDPFATDASLNDVPLSYVTDAVLGDADLLELMCLWSNSIGATRLWYTTLNAGLPVMPVAGTDMMADLYRTMAVGSTRVYAKPNGPLTWRSWFEALKTGRSFVTSGPLLELSVDGAEPGGVVRGDRTVPVTFAVHSAMAVDSVAIVVNGVTVHSEPVPAAPFSRRWTHAVRVPAGGWIAVRVVGPPVTAWPAMADRVFAHTAPVWLGARASTDPEARRAAVRDLQRALASARTRLEIGYSGTEIPRLTARFDAARARLDSLAR